MNIKLNAQLFSTLMRLPEYKLLLSYSTLLDKKISLYQLWLMMRISINILTLPTLKKLKMLGNVSMKSKKNVKCL